MSRLTIALSLFVAMIGLADLMNWGHGYAGLALLAAWYYAARHLGKTAWQRVFGVMLVLSALMAAIGCCQVFVMPRARGLFASPNFLAGYAALHLFLALHWLSYAKSRWLALGAAGANLVSLVLSGSRGGILAAAAGLAALYGRRYPARTSAALALCAGAVAFQYVTRMAGVPEPRLGLWVLGLRIASQRLVTGWGQNAIVLWPLGWSHFYSVPIEWLIAGGVFGFGAGAWMIYEGLRASRSAPALTALLVAWIVNGLFIFDTPATSIPLFTVLAYLASEQRRKKLIARGVDDDQPFLDGRVGAHGAD